MAPRVGRSTSWYSDSGTYMSEINKMLSSRSESGPVDDCGVPLIDDDWELIWRAAPDDWSREII